MTTAITTTDLAPPTLGGILAARRVVAASHARTPLRRLLEAGLAAGREIFVKCEDEAEIKSFKGRGALWRLACLSPDEARHGIITASTGNHGQGVAFAAARAGVRSVVVVPAGSSPLKMNRIKEFGAELRISGTDIAEASQAAQAAALAEGMVYAEDGEDPELMAGAATVGWEILEDLPAAEAIVVPVGGGNLIAGVALAAKCIKPSIKIIGVQSEGAPRGGPLRAEIRHALATRATLLEGAAAAPFAALRRYGANWPARTVLIQSGGNLSLAELEWVLAGEAEG